MQKIKNVNLTAKLSEIDYKRLLNTLEQWGYKESEFSASAIDAEIDDTIIENEHDFIIMTTLDDEDIPEFRCITERETYKSNKYYFVHLNEYFSHSAIRVYDLNNAENFEDYKKELNVSRYNFYKLKKLANYENLYKLINVTEEIKNESKKLDVVGTIRNYLRNLKDEHTDEYEEEAVKFIETNARNKDCYSEILSYKYENMWNKDDSFKRVLKALNKRASYVQLVAETSFARIDTPEFSYHTKNAIILKELLDLDDKYLTIVKNPSKSIIEPILSKKWSYYDTLSQSDVNEILNNNMSVTELVADIIYYYIVRLTNYNRERNLAEASIQYIKYILKYKSDILNKDSKERKELFEDLKVLTKFMISTGTYYSLNSNIYGCISSINEGCREAFAELFAYAIENYNGRSNVICKNIIEDSLKCYYEDAAKIIIDKVFDVASKNNYKKLKKIKMNLKLK